MWSKEEQYGFNDPHDFINYILCRFTEYHGSNICFVLTK
jgi:hypothetical protein